MSSMSRGDSGDDALRVRMASAADGDVFVRFNRAMALETENKTLDEEIVGPGVRAVFDNPARGFYVVAESGSGSDIVAVLMVTFEWSDWRNATFWWIQSVYVTPKFRRRGVYSRLYDFVRARARSEGDVCGFRLYVEKNNVAAQKVYESLGMSASGYLMYEETFSS
jgi:ribosomal protein S18 acetylase RimI-like enzyme